MSNIYFISGHLDLTEDEFNVHYKYKIDAALNDNSKFVIGDARGADSLAQKYLSQKAYNYDKTIYDRVTVYHMFDKPRNNYGKFKTIGGFIDDESRDAQMTNDSNKDILWIRSSEEQKKKLGSKYNPFHISGTTKNMMRRIETKN
ncbi:hypothetical protein QKU48_gp0209 [Fadolivirus algeromassiliense]|jgi:hypothetical protein|uniref:Uncharacterized protein n=1 Tax=Fadolivirus FV1/VV64 TaxID=3070911 RepID=A0A7D3QTW8_9VIRU|nr:hypothetical protein QKU48_gp0209 [Fadolivirus algeromassiliense]QKF93667.1 hypothetical protein Fadolivirus_1_209 [Fadolivirus FV1/VV64]